MRNRFLVDPSMHMRIYSNRNFVQWCLHLVHIEYSSIFYSSLIFPLKILVGTLSMGFVSSDGEMRPRPTGLWGPLRAGLPRLALRGNPNPSLERNPSPRATGRHTLHRGDHRVAALSVFAASPSTRQRSVFRSSPTRIDY